MAMIVAARNRVPRRKGVLEYNEVEREARYVPMDPFIPAFTTLVAFCKYTERDTRTLL